MIQCSRWYIPALLVVFAISMQSRASAFVITAQDWAMPRSAEHLLKFPPLAGAIEQLRVQPEAYLLIHYPGGDEGTLWVNELQSWLVALGVASTQMELIPGSSKQTVIEIDVVSRAGRRMSDRNEKSSRSVVNQ